MQPKCGKSQTPPKMGVRKMSGNSSFICNAVQYLQRMAVSPPCILAVLSNFPILLKSHVKLFFLPWVVRHLCFSYNLMKAEEKRSCQQLTQWDFWDSGLLSFSSEDVDGSLYHTVKTENVLVLHNVDWDSYRNGVKKVKLLIMAMQTKPCCE